MLGIVEAAADWVRELAGGGIPVWLQPLTRWPLMHEAHAHFSPSITGMIDNDHGLPVAGSEEVRLKRLILIESDGRVDRRRSAGTKRNIEELKREEDTRKHRGYLGRWQGTVRADQERRNQHQRRGECWR